MVAVKRMLVYSVAKKESCACGRNVTGSQFYQDHGNCEHCHYGDTDLNVWTQEDSNSLIYSMVNAMQQGDYKQLEEITDQAQKQFYIEAYDMACHNLFCYSANYLMTTWKDGFHVEWTEALERMEAAKQQLDLFIQMTGE